MILYLQGIFSKQVIIPLILAIYLSKECIANDYEIVIIYSFLIFLLFIYFYVKNTINNVYKNIVKSVEKEYKKLGILLLITENTIYKQMFVNYLTYNLYVKLLYTKDINSIIFKEYNIIFLTSYLLHLNEIKNDINITNNKIFTESFINRLFKFFELSQLTNLNIIYSD